MLPASNHLDIERNEQIAMSAMSERLDRNLAKVERTKETMESAVQAAVERQERLSDLESTATHLAEGATVFEKEAKKVETRERVSYYKTYGVYIGAICIIVLLIILVIYKLLL